MGRKTVRTNEPSPLFSHGKNSSTFSIPIQHLARSLAHHVPSHQKNCSKAFTVFTTPIVSRQVPKKFFLPSARTGLRLPNPPK